METALSSKVLEEDEMESGPLAEIDETIGQGALFDLVQPTRSAQAPRWADFCANLAAGQVTETMKAGPPKLKLPPNLCVTRHTHTDKSTVTRLFRLRGMAIAGILNCAGRDWFSGTHQATPTSSTFQPKSNQSRISFTHPPSSEHFSFK